jgi:uncharacterized membrane protein
MALGLFASLLIGTIIGTIGQQANVQVLVDIGNFGKAAAGAAMAVAIGYALKSPPLVLFSLVAVGTAANQLGGAGGPLAVFFIAIIAAEFGKLVSKETPVDILVTPLVTVVIGSLAAMGIAPFIGQLATWFGGFNMWASELQPLFMGIIVSVAVGIALTLPISSAAICAALGLTGLAGGAAVAGCCAQMVGFAVMSFRENRWGGLISQGIGTSMIQMPNILKNPRIWIPPTLASAITGPLATVVFNMRMDGPPIASGMGTCGLVGPIGVITGWANAGFEGIGAFSWVGLALIALVLPAILTWLFGLALRKMGWIKPGDLLLKDIEDTLAEGDEGAEAVDAAPAEATPAASEG